MFTGIIAATGRIKSLLVKGHDAVITVATGKLDLSDVKLGDSIATNGVCLTVTALSQASFSADISGETLKRTTFALAKPNNAVNLEKAMLPTTRFGGHIVSGHVDGVAVVSQVIPLGRATEYWLTVPGELAHYIAEKGSITVDGISLTVNDVKAEQFKITIVPHTAGETTINQFKVGSQVNIEVDVMARYIERMLTVKRDKTTNQGSVTMDLLASAGFLKS